jgi:hypothetical protein
MRVTRKVHSDGGFDEVESFNCNHGLTIYRSEGKYERVYKRESFAGTHGLQIYRSEGRVDENDTCD